MSDYSISSTITADSSGFQKAINETIAGLEDFGDAFSTMTNETKQSFANLANQFTAIDAKAKVWGNSTDIVADKQKALRNEINRLIDSGIKPESQQIQDLKKSYDALGTSGVKSGSSIASSFASLRDVMQGPIAAMQMAKQALDGVWAATIGNASKLEDMEAAFTPLVGGAENAKAMIAALNKEAATTPYELTDIGNVSKQLLPVLGNDIKAVTETFRMLGDTAGGNVQKLDSITRGYVKTMNSGKVSLEALNMISDAGVPIQTQLAESMGMSVSSMYKLISAGKVSSEELTKAFETMTDEGGIFFNGMETASQTLSGKLSTMADAFKTSGAAIGNIFLPMVKDIVTIISDVVGGFAKWATENDNLKNTLKYLAIGLASGAAAFVAFSVAMNIGSIITATSTAFSGLAVAIKTITLALAANPFVAIATVVTAVLVPAVIMLADKLGGWKILFLEIQKIGLTVLKSLLDYFSYVANNFISVMNTMLGIYNKIVSVVGGKQIQLFSKVDIANAAGITEKIVEINDEIRKEKEEQARLAIQNDKTTKTQIDNLDNLETTTTSTYEKMSDTQSKYYDELNKSIEKEKKLNIDAAKKRGESMVSIVDIAKKYDDEILDNYKKNIALQLADAKREAKEKNATAKDIADIENLYALKITSFEKDQTDERIKLSEDYSKDLEALAKKRADFEATWAGKTTTNKISQLKIEKQAALQQAKDLGASAETLAKIQAYYAGETTKAYTDTAQQVIGAFSTLATTVTRNMDQAIQSAVSYITTVAVSVSKLVASGGTDIAAWAALAATAVAAVMDLFDGLYASVKDRAKLADKAVESAKEMAEAAKASAKAYADAYSASLAEVAAQAAKAKNVLVDLLKVGQTKTAKSVSAASIVAYYQNIATAAKNASDAEQGEYNTVVSTNAAKVDAMKKTKKEAQKVYDDAKRKADIAKGVMDAAWNAYGKIPLYSIVEKGAAWVAARTAEQAYSVFAKDLDSASRTLESASTSYASAVSIASSETGKAYIELTAAQKEAAKQNYIFSTVFAQGVTDATVTLQEEWATALSSVYATYGETSQQVAELNSQYARQIYEALYPVAAALERNQNALALNISLWKAAGKSVDAFKTQLSNLAKTASGVYESFANIGTDIASSLVDGLSKGLGESDFMKTMKEYITKIVVQTAVYTDSLMTQMASIGTEIANAVASGVSTANMGGIVAKLKTLYAQATANAAAATAVVNQAFSGYASGTSSAVAGYHMVGEQGPELMYTPGGSTVYNNNETNNIIGALAGGGSRGTNVTLAPVFNSPKAMNQAEQMRAMKQYQKQLAFKGVI